MFGSTVNKAIMEHAESSPEKEICGYILNNSYVPGENASTDPEGEFRMYDVPDDAQAIIHSHPGGPFYPTEFDMRQQVASGIPWGVACFAPLHKEIFWMGDEVEMPPLVGRGFRHGVTDCYSLIRDFYRSRYGIFLDPGYRSWEWWYNDEDLYRDNFTRAGFHTVSPNEIRAGDIFLATIRAKVPNHGGVYLGNGLILHHTAGKAGYDPTQLSVVEPAHRWMRHLSMVLRYEDDRIDGSPIKRFW